MNRSNINMHMLYIYMIYVYIFHVLVLSMLSVPIFCITFLILFLTAEGFKKCRHDRDLRAPSPFVPGESTVVVGSLVGCVTFSDRSRSASLFFRLLLDFIIAGCRMLCQSVRAESPTGWRLSLLFSKQWIGWPALHL